MVAGVCRLTVGDARVVGDVLERLEGVPLSAVRVGVSVGRPEAFYAVAHRLGLAEVWPVRRLSDCVSFLASGTFETVTVTVNCFLPHQDGKTDFSSAEGISGGGEVR